MPLYQLPSAEINALLHVLRGSSFFRAHSVPLLPNVAAVPDTLDGRTMGSAEIILREDQENRAGDEDVSHVPGHFSCN